jgi:hypothetical protein
MLTWAGGALIQTCGLGLCCVMTPAQLPGLTGVDKKQSEGGVP